MPGTIQVQLSEIWYVYSVLNKYCVVHVSDNIMESKLP